MTKLAPIFLSLVISLPAFAAVPTLTTPQRTCLDAWSAVFTDSDISGPEAITNAGVGVVGAITGSTATKASGTVKFAVQVALGVAAMGTIVLAANEEWEIIDRLFKEAQVGTGATLSQLGQALQEEGNTVASSDVVAGIKALDPREEGFAQYFCTQEMRPVILGRYIQKVITIK